LDDLEESQAGEATDGEFQVRTRTSDQVCVRICGQKRSGVGSANSWFSSLLETSCKLVRKANETHNFANEAQLLLVCADSINALQMQGPSNFRPNLVIANGFEEKWSAVTLHTTTSSPFSSSTSSSEEITRAATSSLEIKFRVTGPCARCCVVDVDIKNGVRGDGKWLRAVQGVFGLFLQQETTQTSTTYFLEENTLVVAQL